MYKKVAAFFIVLISLGVFMGNEYTKMAYDVTLWSYWSNDSSLTNEELDWLRDQDKLIYGANYNSPPLRYINSSSSQYEGLVIDYLRQLSLELGVNIEFKPLVWHDSLTQLADGQTDFCDMYTSEERSKNFIFTSPVYYQRGVIVVGQDDHTIDSYKNLHNKTIAAVKGDFVFEFLDSEALNVNRVETKDLQEAIELLESGKVDAVLGDESVINYFMVEKDLTSDYKILSKSLYERPAVFGVNKNNTMLVNILNKGIRSLNKKGSMEQIHEKWFGVSPLITKDISRDRYLLLTKFLAALILVIAIGFYTLNLELKHEVIKRTHELSISKNELQTTFDGLTYLMLVINRECIVKEANTALCNRINYPKDGVINHHCSSINGMLGTDCDHCIMKESLDTNKQMTREIEYEDRLYKVNTFLLETFPNMVDRVLVMIEDVTDSKIKDQIMLQSSKMAAVGQLASGVAHEIRNPLGLIRNYCYLIKNSFDEPDEISHSVGAIESAVARANKIITNLLDFSSLTGNTISNINVYKFLEEISILNAKNFSNRNINFEFHCDSDLSLNLNSESLKHILINLIENATDAIESHGTIAIHAYADGDTLVMKVADTGIGMDDDVKSNIFNPFFTTKDPQKGTGLGLYVAYSELEKMSGTISVDSKLNVGTTFTLNIPNQKGDISYDTTL